MTAHLVVCPVPNIDTTVWPGILSFSVDFVVEEAAFVVAAVGELQPALVILEVVMKIAFETCSVLPLLSCFTFETAIHPRTCRCACSLRIVLDSGSMFLSAPPASLVPVPVGACVATLPVSVIVLPLAFVDGAVWKRFLSFSALFSIYVSTSIELNVPS